MNKVQQGAIGVTFWVGIATSAMAVPIQIDINKLGGYPAFSIKTDSSDLTVQRFSADPPFPASTEIYGDFLVKGPDPAPPLSGVSTLPPGPYTASTEYVISLGFDFDIPDITHFSASGAEIDPNAQLSTYQPFSYEVLSGGMVQLYLDPPTDLSVYSISVNTISSVPLPASAPMFGAALLALGTAGFGLKRKKAAASA